MRPRTLLRLALLWSATTAGLAGSWLGGWLPHPFTNAEAAAIGAVFNTSHPRVGSLFTLGLGLAGAACGLAGLRALRRGHPGRVAPTAAWVLAAAPLLVLVHGALLALLGYTPYVLVRGWFDPALASDYLDALADPETLFLLHALAGGLVWGAAAIALGRWHRRACPVCGRASDWTPASEAGTRARALVVGRLAVAVAVVSALAYPAVRLPWLLGLPMGIDAATWARLEATPGMIETGVALAVTGVAGATLMLGLVQDWGVRFPRWLVGLAGRRVPVTMAVVPAAVVAVALVALGRGAVVGIATGQLDTPAGTPWSNLLALVSMLPWGLALGVATAAYAVRRRAECPVCDRGLAEPAQPVGR